MDTPNFQVSFMPWAGIQQTIQVGPVTFWPFQLQVTERVADTRIREYLEKYFRCYVNHQGKPVNSVTICSHGAVNFRQLIPSEAGEVRAAVDALLFSVICPAIKNAVLVNNISMLPPSVDKYQLFTQNFHSDANWITVRTGNVLSAGWKIGEISFPQPWTVGNSFESPDPELLNSFSKVFDLGFPAEQRQRFQRSLEWFRLAHVESDEVSPLSKVVMMVTAFEILLDVPDQPNKKEWIANRLDKLCKSPNTILEHRQIRGQTVTHSKMGWWAFDFYNLRNKVVHGDPVGTQELRYSGSSRVWLTHLIVADLVFWECLTRELYAHRCIGDSVKEFSAKLDKMFPNKPANTAKTDLLASLAGFGFAQIHKALGWACEPENVP
jgi:hypothetical protein